MLKNGGRNYDGCCTRSLPPGISLSVLKFLHALLPPHGSACAHAQRAPTHAQGITFDFTFKPQDRHHTVQKPCKDLQTGTEKGHQNRRFFVLLSYTCFVCVPCVHHPRPTGPSWSFSTASQLPHTEPPSSRLDAF